jgi:hypothetical protein
MIVGPLFTPELHIFADCATFPYHVSTWVDENRNGNRDSGEPPLAYVQVYMDDIHNNFLKVVSGVTDADGRTGLRVFIAGCVATEMEVYAEAPEGYCFTTPERLQSNLSFGFAPCDDATVEGTESF